MGTIRTGVAPQLQSGPILGAQTQAAGSPRSVERRERHPRLGETMNRSSRQGFGVRVLAAGIATAVLALAGAATASAATVTFGSPLNVPAKLTTNELDYTAGTHDGADTALWNVALPGES